MRNFDILNQDYPSGVHQISVNFFYRNLRKSFLHTYVHKYLFNSFRFENNINGAADRLDSSLLWRHSIIVRMKVYLLDQSISKKFDSCLKTTSPALQIGSTVLCSGTSYSIGRVLFVGVNRVVDKPGPGSCGFAILSPLPESMWGSNNCQKLSLRRVCVPESEEEITEAMEKELSKMPCALHVTSPLRLRDLRGKLVCDAGRSLAEMSLEVSEKLFSKSN